MTVLADLNERFPFTVGLSGQPLADAIAANWDTMDDLDKAQIFKRMAMYVAVHDK